MEVYCFKVLKLHVNWYNIIWKQIIKLKMYIVGLPSCHRG